MAITLISSPSTWARVNDTNRMTYTFSSTNTGLPNFQFQFLLRVWEADGSYNDCGTFNVYPLSGGTVEFNPSTIYRNYFSYDYNNSITQLTEAKNSAKKTSLSVYEYYGTPPARSSKAGEYWTGELGGGTPLNVYNGCQQSIPYDYTQLNSSGNLLWVMSPGGTKGRFLTDATEYRLDDDDKCFLWFNAQSPNRPTQIRYTLTYICYGYTWHYEDSIAGSPSFINDPGNSQSQAFSYPFFNFDITGHTTPPGYTPYTGVCTDVYYDTNVSYTSFNSLQHYFPMGPQQLWYNEIFPSGQTQNWLYYDIDLLSGSTVMNRDPFRVYRVCKSNRYGRWQLNWLNKHGGFDFYTFDRKNEVRYKTTKDTYKQKLQVNPGFSPYDAGQRVFNIQSEQEITLRSDLLTQKEAQLLIGLTQSPRVYVNTYFSDSGTYALNPGKLSSFGVPYIVTTADIIYPQKVNDKEIVMEIKIRPANDMVFQND